jgi:hypothetical protein
MTKDEILVMVDELVRVKIELNESAADLSKTRSDLTDERHTTDHFEKKLNTLAEKLEKTNTENYRMLNALAPFAEIGKLIQRGKVIKQFRVTGPEQMHFRAALVAYESVGKGGTVTAGCSEAPSMLDARGKRS